MKYWLTWGILIILTNAAFTWTSRSRNSPSLKYHAIGIVCAQNIYFVSGLFALDNGLKILRDANWMLALWTVIFYTVCNLIGGLGTQYLLVRYLEPKMLKTKEKTQSTSKAVQESPEQGNKGKEGEPSAESA